MRLPWNLLSTEDPLFAIDDVPGEAAQFERMGQLWDANCDHNPLVSCDFFCGGFAEQFERNGERIAGFIAGKLDLQGESRVLDLGAGIGRIARTLAPRVGYYALADVSPKMLQSAGVRLKGIPALTYTLIERSRPLPWPDGSFDHVVAIDLIPHLPQAVLRSYFAEVTRLLVPGGLFFLSTAVPPGANPAADPEGSRRPLRLLNLKPVPFGTHTGIVLAELTERGPLKLRSRADDFPNQLPLLPFKVPLPGCYLIFQKNG